MHLLGLVIMSLSIFMYGAIPLLAGLNQTHAMNSSWSAHARFHVANRPGLVLPGTFLPAWALSPFCVAR